MTYWREAGLTYLQFSTVAARLVRRALKVEKRGDFTLRETSTLKKLPDQQAKKAASN